MTLFLLLQLGPQKMYKPPSNTVPTATTTPTMWESILKITNAWSWEQLYVNVGQYKDTYVKYVL